MKNTNNNMGNYDTFWKGVSKTPSWREYILPKRTETEFFNEGKQQATVLNDLNLFDETSSILEFGCGIGRVLKYINTNDTNKTGVDVCQAYLDKITIWIPENGR